MKRKKKRGGKERLIFDSIRKPTAPPVRKIGDGSKPQEKAYPAKRNTKYKKTEDIED